MVIQVQAKIRNNILNTSIARKIYLKRSRVLKTLKQLHGFAEMGLHHQVWTARLAE